MDAEKRLEKLHVELQELDRKQNEERRKRERTKSSKLSIEKLIAFYQKTCRLSQQKEDEYFMHCLRGNKFEVNVSRMQSVSERDDDDDLLSCYLKVLKHKESASLFHSVSIIDDSESNKSKSRNKQLIGSRLAVALCKFLKSFKSHSAPKRRGTSKGTATATSSTSHCKLESIEIRGIQIESKRHWQILSDSISKLSSLRTLSLHNMPLHDENAVVLCRALRRSELNRLSLSQCGLTADCAQSISRLIAAHSNHRSSMEWQRKLRGNKMSKNGFSAFRTGLSALDLSQNKLSNDGLRVLTNALIQDDDEAGILWIDLRANGITKCAVIDVIKMLKRNSKILHFDLTQNSGIPPNIALEICTILALRRTQNGPAVVVDDKFMGKTRDFNAKQTTTPRFSYKSSRINTVRPSNRNSMRNSHRNSIKSTPKMTKIKKERTSKAVPTTKINKKTANKKSVKSTTSKRVRTNRTSSSKQFKRRRTGNIGNESTKRMEAKRTRNGINGFNANEILKDILSEYKSTKMECHKLTKQKETISQIIDSLEVTFHRFSDFIDSIESHKARTAPTPNRLDQETQHQELQRVATTDLNLHSIEAQRAHNVIEQRLRQIWDSRLNQAL